MKIKNKLIKIFKDGCTSSKVNIERVSTGTTYICANNDTYPISKDPFILSDHISNILETLHLVYVGNDGINYNTYPSSDGHIRFEFGVEPPLLLMSSYIDIKVKFKDDFLLTSNYIDRDSVKRKPSTSPRRFFFEKLFDKISGRVPMEPIQFKTCIIKTKESILATIIKLNNENDEISFPFTISDEVLAYSSSRDYKDFVNIYNNFSTNVHEDDFSHDNIIKSYNNKFIRINGGIISFGGIFCWVSHTEYLELVKYYEDSIAIKYESILDERLLEINKD